MKFPAIDTSYWKTDDPLWVKERKNEWSEIEPMLKHAGQKSKKAITIIKRYFLKGDMPDFIKLKDWGVYERHLDLFCFIWLHPSWDEPLLTELRNTYINSPVIKEADALYGIGSFLSNGKRGASLPYTKDEIGNAIFTDGHNELLFKVLMGDITDLILGPFSDVPWTTYKPKSCITSTYQMTRWLCVDSTNVLNEDCLYQYDLPLESWYQGCTTDETFFEKSKNKGFLPLMEIALYRIHHYDVEKYGDTARSRFVIKMRKILDERSFIPVFKQIWLDVQAGKIKIEDAWDD